MAYKVEITSCSHDPSMTTGYAEGKLDRLEFTASWATYEPLGALFYDTWLDTTQRQNQAIAKALNSMKAVPKVVAPKVDARRQRSSNRMAGGP